ncbi:DinB superfamily protein [Chryseobacterium piscicola]|uniref:DNA damage-inducible protein DinB n=1 Tax=Chryseobacterium piscicola TaxID=551459 RepID=A0A1N7L721_9FLAO|nr:DinB family protein [Chryseobacterium piscicola]PQA97408.1 DNA damage-inducible protein DinB [Chryseobacterium piscicola]SIS69606.1 DinB superfamily protein [Chryseobacterium piscicola]
MTDFEKYIQRYLDLIPTENWLEELKKVGEKTISLYSYLTEEQSKFAYAEGKWTLKEVLLHLSDTERVFQYRILAFARGEKSELPGFDEESYAANSFANERSLESLLEEYQLVRKSSQILLETLNPSVLSNIGIANGNKISVETICQLIVGHNIHHLNVVEERYLPEL